jgi:hypothetical protein
VKYAFLPEERYLNSIKKMYHYVLIEASIPAPYGDLKTQETVINTDVRKAFEIKEFEVGDAENEFYLDDIEYEISKFMNETVTLKQEKINIYTRRILPLACRYINKYPNHDWFPCHKLTSRRRLGDKSRGFC